MNVLYKNYVQKRDCQSNCSTGLKSSIFLHETCEVTSKKYHEIETTASHVTVVTSPLCSSVFTSCSNSSHQSQSLKKLLRNASLPSSPAHFLWEKSGQLFFLADIFVFLAVSRCG